MKILAVEDSEDDIDFMNMSLEKNNLVTEVELLEAKSLEDARFRLSLYSFDLIFLDINLPPYRGIDFLKELRDDSKFNLVPIIMFTTSNRKKDIVESYEYGANMYLVKPLSYKDFINVFGSAVNFWNKYPVKISSKV